MAWRGTIRRIYYVPCLTLVWIGLVGPSLTPSGGVGPGEAISGRLSVHPLARGRRNPAPCVARRQRGARHRRAQFGIPRDHRFRPQVSVGAYTDCSGDTALPHTIGMRYQPGSRTHLDRDRCPMREVGLRTD
jgi:hypothetical protein